MFAYHSFILATERLSIFLAFWFLSAYPRILTGEIYQRFRAGGGVKTTAGPLNLKALTQISEYRGPIE
jgi:hypothetical protein